MPKRLKTLLPLIFPLTLAACGNALEGYSPPPEIPITETVVEKSFNETWRDLLFVAADNSYRIIELDQDAGTMVLQFDSATGFVNCGTFKGRPAHVPDGVVELAINVTRLRESQTRFNLQTTYGRTRTSHDDFFDPQVSLTLILPMYAIIGAHTTCLPTHAAEHTIVNRISSRDVLGPSTLQVAAKLAR